MSRRKQTRGRPIDGILLLDKPTGITSNSALQQTKYAFYARKAGHTGSLDPLASGLLPICFGECTKLSAFLLDADKSYRLTCQFGVQTDSADSDGEVTLEQSFADVTEASLQATLPTFLGEQQQIPPMYSAVHHQGKRLYELAREGVEVEREPRDINIFSIELVSLDLPYAVIDVRCSKGTYVRTLAEDIAKRLNTVAHITALRRTAVGPYNNDSMTTLQQLQDMAEEKKHIEMDDLLLSPDTALDHLPELHLSADSAFYVRQGNPVMVPERPDNGLLRLYDEAGKFFGVGEIQDDGKVGPKRLFALQ